MSRKWMICGVLAAGIVVGAVVVRSADDGPSVAEMREEFLDEFRRTGLATTPDDALLLRILIQARNARRGIEVGTEAGFGAVNMGIGFERTGGHLFTLEISPRLVKAARANIARTKLDKTVTVVEGDALKTLPTLEGEFDFLFLDAVKRDYFRYFKLVEKKLKPGAVIVADNAIRSARPMKDFLDFMRESKDYEMVVVRASDAKRDGMAICYKVR